MSINGKKGIAMILALIILVLVSGITVLIFTRTMGELGHSRDNAAIVQALNLSRSGALYGVNYINGTQVQNELKGVMEGLIGSLTGSWFFGTGNNANTRPTPVSVVRGTSSFGEIGINDILPSLQFGFDQLFCDTILQPQHTVGQIRLRLYVDDTACGEPLPASVNIPQGRFVSGGPRTGTGAIATQRYAIPYVLMAIGTIGEYERNVIIHGEFQFQSGSSSFARYAYFTNTDREAGVWQYKAVYDGPAHTNSTFQFYRESWFGGTATSAGCNNGQAFQNAQGDWVCNSQSAGASFWGQGFVAPENMSPSPQSPAYSNAQPVFSGGVDWRSSYVDLPSNNQDQRRAAQGLNANGNLLSSQGLLISGVTSVTRLRLRALGANGNELTAPAGAINTETTNWGNGPAVFQEIAIELSDGTTRTYRMDENFVLYRDITEHPQWDASDPQATGPINSQIVAAYLPDADGYVREVNFEQHSDADGNGIVDPPAGGAAAARPFNGVIFSDAPIDRFTGPDRNVAGVAPPAIAAFARITVATDSNSGSNVGNGTNDYGIRITGDLKYESLPISGITVRDNLGNVIPALDANLDAVNVLGIYSQSANIIVGHNNSTSSYNAPRDVTVNASMMTSDGVIKVEDHDRGGTRGRFNLLGGFIQNTRGPFGTFNTGTGQVTNGFERGITYDKRFLDGLSPPYFPTTNTTIADAIVPYTFGQQEQVR